MMRFCPNCSTERSVDEMFCEGELDGKLCDWPLSGLPMRQLGWRPTVAAQESSGPTASLCANGHNVEPGNLLCPTCGADVAERVTTASAPGPDVRLPAPTADAPAPAEAAETTIGEWRLLSRLPTTSDVQ